jgi:Cu/Ag efflux protein CusF
MTTKFTIWATAGIFVTTFILGCGTGTSEKAAKSYPIKGTVTAIDLKKPSVKLDHEDIPGLMQAMEMSFSVKDAKILEGLKTGDRVTGDLVKDDSGMTITRLEKAEKKP